MTVRSKILVVDDDPGFTAFLVKTLGERYEVVATNQSAEALELAQRVVPDLVLCGVDMPDPDGYEVCRRLKATPELADLPVLFVTAANASENEARGFEVGGADYIHKPVEPRVLEARMQTQLALRDAQRALRDQAARLEAMVAERTAQVEQSRAALRGAMHNLRTTVVTTGVYWIQVPEAGLYILCGSPADVVKHLMLRGYIVEEMKDGVLCETGPNVILLSDVLVQNGRFANLAEFPVLQMLYRQGLLIPGHPNNTGRKPMLIGSERQVRAQLDYIYRGNYGLVSEEELIAAGLDKEEARQQMAIKMAFAFGKIRPSEDLLDVRVIGPEPIELANGVTATRLGLNRYAFEYQGQRTDVDLNLGPEERYDAPYSMGHHTAERHYFAVIHCGQGDGWDLQRQSMGSIVAFQGRYYLVDAGPNILHTLKTLGIDVSEIEGVFHTHAHDDHFAGLPTLIASGHRIKYFATPLVRHSVTKKLAALMSVSERDFGEFFDVRDLREGRWNNCDGMEVMPLASPHPVETTLFLFRASDEEGPKTYAHWADIASFKVLREIVSKPPARGALPPGFLESVKATYLQPATLKKIDAGGGMIHGDPSDFADDESTKIVLAHRATPFDPDELEIGSEASFGAVDVLIASSQDYDRQRAFRVLSQIFPDAGPDILKELLLSPIDYYNAGSLIMRPGETAPCVYLSVAGSVEQREVGTDLSFTLPTGSLIGTHALFDERADEDFWRASSPVRLMRIDLQTMRAFLTDGGWYDLLRQQLEEAAFLQSTPLFGERVAFIVQSRVARASTLVNVAAGEPLPPTEAPALWLVRSGGLDLIDRDGYTLEYPGTGAFVGEEACLGRPAAPWHARARRDSELMLISAGELRAIPIVLWKMLETHERRLQQALFRA